MRRPWVIIIVGMAIGLAAYSGVYFARTAENQSVEKSRQPTLSWLQKEYHLSDQQFDHVCELYAAYQPKCVEMCRRIDEQNSETEKLLAATNLITPEITEALSKAVRLRVECQSAMLAHFYEVAEAMPPEDGKRYLAWVQQETLTPGRMPPTKQPQQSK